jgi:hypothetical protein
VKDIIYISSFPLPLRYEKFLYINELLEAGFNVEYWTIDKFFFPERPSEILGNEPVVTSDYCIDITTFDELLNKLKKKARGNLIFYADRSILTRICRYGALIKLLKKKKFITFFMEHSSFPWPKQEKLSRRARFTRFAMLDFKSKIIKIKNYVLNHLKRFWKAVFFDFSCDIIIGPNPPSNCSRKVYINYIDYERYRVDSHLPDLIKVKYAIFLDSYFPLHPDLKRWRPKTPPTEENAKQYLKLMNNFFTVIERQFGVQVVIAAHPTSKYTEADYGGRVVLKGKTCQLIQYAQFAILHGSSSVTYAVLRHCPLLYCYTNDFRIFLETSINRNEVQSQLLKAPFIQVEQYIVDSGLPIPEPNIDREACEEYKYTYLTRPEIENKENKDIILELFRSL